MTNLITIETEDDGVEVLGLWSGGGHIDTIVEPHSKKFFEVNEFKPLYVRLLGRVEG